MHNTSFPRLTQEEEGVIRARCAGRLEEKQELPTGTPVKPQPYQIRKVQLQGSDEKSSTDGKCLSKRYFRTKLSDYES
jgi:hypothetical protein